jgi:hypothetical protein
MGAALLKNNLQYHKQTKIRFIILFSAHMQLQAEMLTVVLFSNVL